MKRTLSVILALLMVLGSVGGAFAAETVDAVTISAPADAPLLIMPKPAEVPADVVGTGHEEAVKALLNFKVTSGYTDGTYRPDNTLTRAEACTFLVNYLAPTAEELAAAPDFGFTDVSGWATQFVNYAASRGITAGYKDNTFRPDKKVTYQEMATMTVNTLGIKPEELTGTWPDNFVNKAKELGMYTNIDVAKANTDPMDRGDVAEMIYSLIKNQDTDVSADVAKKLAESQKLLNELESVHYEMLMDMVMTMGEESLDMTMAMDMDMTTEPLAMYMTSDVSAMGQTQRVEYYYITEGDELWMYMLMDGQWAKMSMGDADVYMESQNPMEDLELYMNAYDNVRIEGYDFVGGKKATKIYCELSEEYIEEAMETAGVMENAGVQMTEEDMAVVNETLKTMKGFGYEMWLDGETGTLVKIRMDMTKMMGDMIKAITNSLTGEDPAVQEELAILSIDKILIEMMVDKINTVEEIRLPEAAKDAADLNASGEEAAQ